MTAVLLAPTASIARHDDHRTDANPVRWFNALRPQLGIERPGAVSAVSVTRRSHGTPGERLVNPNDPVVGDPAEGAAEPGLRINNVQLGAFDQGIDDGGRLAAFGRAGKGTVLPARRSSTAGIRSMGSASAEPWLTNGLVRSTVEPGTTIWAMSDEAA
jgi:hypothetical protein